ncbi:MAG: efflux RND transporter periplasmic adaptor subunit [Candidatus Sumerlaeia bacterium]|nr:efflux RND transporter periplasmic adaptor subunit [Candidatus Sumerlaeia bacterium]
MKLLFTNRRNFGSTAIMNYYRFKLVALFMIIASSALYHPAFSAEDEHAGHNHDEHGHEENSHTEEVAPKEESHEGHDHDDHGHEGEHEEEGHTDEVFISPESMKMFGITLQTLELQRLTETTKVPGRVSYNTEAMAHVGTTLNGRAIEIPARLGDTVKKGDILAVIQSVELGQKASELLEKRSLLEAAESMVEVARINNERANELRKTNSITISEALRKQGELKQAEGSMKVAQASFTATKSELRMFGFTDAQVENLLASEKITTRYELRAPIDGQIIEREVTAGEVVGPDKDLLFIIADPKNLWVLAEVPERLAHRVLEGSKGTITLGHFETTRFDGTVSFISSDVNPRTRTTQARIVVDMDSKANTSIPDDQHHGHDHGAESAPVLSEAEVAQYKSTGVGCPEHNVPESKCELCNPKVEHKTPATQNDVSAIHLMRPGLFVEVELDLENTSSATTDKMLMVPMDAVQTVEGKQTVFIPADEPNTFKPATVQFGKRVGRMVPVLSGLSEGDSYVATGSFMLKAELGKAGAEHVH